MPPLPPPLPPETRTVGQLVAEAIQLYGRRVRVALPLGLGPAALVLLDTTFDERIAPYLLLAVGPLLLAASYAGAAAIAIGGRRREVALGFVAAVPAVLPFVISRGWPFAGSYLLAVAWFAVFGLAVPAIFAERCGLLESFARSARLAAADIVHAVGSLATLVIVIVLSLFALLFLLANFGDQALPIAAFLALVVVSPLFFLGASLLYYDQEARERKKAAAPTR